MTLEQAKRKLSAVGQEHLLRYWDELDEEQRSYLLEQIEELDMDLLKLVQSESEKVPRGKIEPLGAVTIGEIQRNRHRYESVGIQALKERRVGAVLLAGGQGTRLGLDKPKGMLNVGVEKELYLFGQLIQNMLHVVDKAGKWIPLFIMTSEKNHKNTVMNGGRGIGQILQFDISYPAGKSKHIADVNMEKYFSHIGHLL